MIAFITLCYASLYFLIFNKFALLQKSTANVSAFAGVGVVLIASIVFAWYTFAPLTPSVHVVRYLIPIVPNVKGQLIDVPVEQMQWVNRGETLYRIDPTPYQFKVDELTARVEQYIAQRELSRINRDRLQKLVAKQAASQVDLDVLNAQYAAAVAAVASTEASLQDARWQLDETVVTAPANGYPIALQLHPGSFVTTMPMASALAFMSMEDTDIVASFSQSAIRRIQVGDATELVFTTRPGQVYSGRVSIVGMATGESQIDASSDLRDLSGASATGLWPVVVELDDEEVATRLPQGAGGTMAVYTDAGKPFHAISKIVMRMKAWTGYLTSP